MNQLFVQIIWNEHLFQSAGKKYIIEKDNRTGLQHNSFHEEAFVLAAQFNVHSHIMIHLLTLKSIKTWKIKVVQATNSISLLPFRIKLTFYSVTLKQDDCSWNSLWLVYVLLWTNVIAASLWRQQQLSDPLLSDRITSLKTDSFGVYLKLLQLTLVVEGCKTKRLRAAVRRHRERGGCILSPLCNCTETDQREKL